MKYLTGIILGFILIFGLTEKSFAQCEPDTENCIDVGDPGEVCPDVLPVGYLGEQYQQNITILSPESGRVGELNITLAKIRLESIENLPPGITFNFEEKEFFPNEVYCVSLDGIPQEMGTYVLKITVTPFISVLGVPVRWGEYVDSTSVVLTVEYSSAIEEMDLYNFESIPAFPNPYSETTKIGFISPDSSETELHIFNLLGREVYYERVQSVPGANFFDFAGQDLPAGNYFYSISNQEDRLSGRFIRLK